VQILLLLRIGTIIRNRPSNLFANLIEAAISRGSTSFAKSVDSGKLWYRWGDDVCEGRFALTHYLLKGTNSHSGGPDTGGANHERCAARRGITDFVTD
jgi:hypothetical protein